jgi:hypothetical protein
MGIRVLFFVVTGLAFQLAGLSDSLLVYLTGIDLGINFVFWYRFICNLTGLLLIGTAFSLLMPDRFRAVLFLVIPLISTYVAFLPGYYRYADGPLAVYQVSPIEMIRNPYAPTEKPKRRENPGPELAKNTVTAGGCEYIASCVYSDVAWRITGNLYFGA